VSTIQHLVFCLFLSAAGPVAAAELAVLIYDGKGVAIPEAVVTLLPQRLNDAAVARSRMPLRQTVDQRNETFIPHVTLLARGGHVVFANSDATRHHVYSFSAARAFALVLAPGESSEPVSFERNGVVAIGCNIHDRMVAYVYVSDVPWGALSNKDGRAVFSDPPKGTYLARVWHPRMRPGRPEPSQTVALADGASSISFTLELLPDRSHRHDRECVRY